MKDQEGGLEVLLSNVERLDEKIDEERQAVYNMMGILENLSEVMPEIGVSVMKNELWLKWALQRYDVMFFFCSRDEWQKLPHRIKADEFDENKGYAAEIVSILLQNSPESRKIFAAAEGIDTLLVSLAVRI